MQNEDPRTNRRKLSPLKKVLYAGFAAGATLLLCVMTILVFPNPLVNRFIKPRMTTAFAEAYPAYAIRIGHMNCSILKNRLELDSVVLKAVDGTISSTIGTFSVSAIGWMHLLWGGSLQPVDFANAVVDARDIMLNFPQSHYELRCKRLRVVVPDSQAVADALELHPLAGDEEFFRGSKIRSTRFIFVTPQCNVTGLACLALLEGKSCRTRSIRVHDPFLDVLINKDKAASKDSSSPLMPNEVLSSLEGALQVDSLSIMNGRLKYGERFAIGATPALITLDSMEMLAEGIANHGEVGAAYVVHAQGTFMKAGMMKVRMVIPVASTEFSYKYSGSLSGMDLGALNAFLETAEQMRIKAGFLQTATFDIDVVSGRASGTVRAVYRNLTIAAINKHTGSEKGFTDGIASFIANTFKIRGTNVPDKSGAIKIGKVKYKRQYDDPFFRFTWFALRSGVADVVGF